MAGKLCLSKEAVSVVVKTIQKGAATYQFEDALEIGYQGFGEIACTGADYWSSLASRVRHVQRYTHIAQPLPSEE